LSEILVISITYFTAKIPTAQGAFHHKIFAGKLCILPCFYAEKGPPEGGPFGYGSMPENQNMI
jgi:hypothetical protein